ncbi:MAG: hypothetical protein ACRDHW_22065, partial [Ktedonobacteraceae bacterium]
MTNPISLDIQTLPEEISAFLGPIQQLTFPPQGDTSTVAVVDTARGKYVIKRSYGEQFGSWIKQEYNVLRALIQSPFATPYPHMYVSREIAGTLEAWLVMSYLPGDPVVVAVANEPDPE